MRTSFHSHSFARARLGLAVLAAAGLTACGGKDDLQEVSGAVQAWAGDVAAPPAPGVTFSSFEDDVGARAGGETRALITSAQAYADYFGHAPPKTVDLGREWVIFYSAGKRPSGGYKADVRSVLAKGDLLSAVTALYTPGRCPATDVITTPYVLVKLPAQKTRSIDFQHVEVAARCGTEPADPCAAVKCGAGTRCVVQKTNPPTAACEPDTTTNPCAAILCGPDQTCVVLESYPPQAKCVSQPVRCTSSNQCGKGERCSTERGDCQGCGAGPGVACPAVCYGVCEPTGGGGTCTGGPLDGGCKSEAALKQEAADLCKKQGLALTDFGVANACFAGGFADAKYTCCGETPKPPAPACKVDSDCRLTASYCSDAPCTCSASSTGAATPAADTSLAAPGAPLPPACAAPDAKPVQCFADPCGQKVAACEAGSCVVRAAK